MMSIVGSLNWSIKNILIKLLKILINYVKIKLKDYDLFFQKKVNLNSTFIKLKINVINSS